MILQLQTKTEEQKLIKEYLESNVDERLANKINNGVKTSKDGKEIINKKDLDGFMSYATEEAKKLVEKNARSACVRSDVVFGWAMHYFDEDEILGSLYNLDGSEYKPVKPKTQPIKPTTTSIPYTPPKPKEQQTSLFDLFSATPETKEGLVEQDEEPTKQDLQEAMEELASLDDSEICYDENGEILNNSTQENTENPLKQILLDIFEEILIER